MNDDEFEWNDARAAANYAKHGVSFAMGRDVFNDPFAIEQIDDRHDYGEERWTILGMAQDRLLLVVYAIRQNRVRLISLRPSPLNDENIMNKTRETTKHDWSRLDAMSEAERHAAALSDPDAQPLTPEDFKRMKRTPQVTVIRRALGLSQEEFAARFHIPVGTLRD
jgi:putative transcriptional regulator